MPGEELADDRRRSSIGRLSRRPDLAALALLFTFGALLNAFAMTGPVYAIEHWMARALRHDIAKRRCSACIFVVGLGVAAAGALRRLQRRAHAAARRGSALSVQDIAVRYAYALVPFGAGVWLAHYGFHFLTGALDVVPVTQSAAIDAGGPRRCSASPTGDGSACARVRSFRCSSARCCSARWARSSLAHRISERDSPEGAARARRRPGSR